MTGIRKLILKNDCGTPRGVLTVRYGEGEWLRCPIGFRPLLLEVEGERLSCREGMPTLPKECGEITLIGEQLGETLYATTRTGEDAALAKWRLKEALYGRESEGKVPTSPLAEEKDEESDPLPSPPAAEAECDPLEEEAEEGAATLEQADPIAKARRLIESGEPFLPFQSLMPSSRWARIKGEACDCLIGIVREGEQERVLYGVAGDPAYPPDEDRLWTYFPTGENEGYYLTEYEE